MQFIFPNTKGDSNLQRAFLKPMLLPKHLTNEPLALSLVEMFLGWPISLLHLLLPKLLLSFQWSMNIPLGLALC